MKIWKNTNGVSEIVGTIMLLAIAVALFSVIYVIVFSENTPISSPSVQIVGYIDNDAIILEHHGGDSLSSGTQIQLTIGGNQTTLNISSPYLHDYNDNDQWDLGEKIAYTADLQGLSVRAVVTNQPSNSALFFGTLQEGAEGSSETPSPICTSVSSITPYEISSSPLAITATSSGTNPDNITLYYRWSENNWSCAWNILTYDDFEGGFGNYTSGGDDCSLYTEGTYAHQGNNAANIQDNYLDESSFYHTDGLDVDTLEYASITVDFWFYPVDMDPGSDFWVQYYNGTDWSIVKEFTEGIDFENGQFYHETIWINETEYVFPDDMKIKFMCNSQNNNNDVYIDEIYINASNCSAIDWIAWTDSGNPDSSSPWIWDFDFPNGPGYYEFYSMGKKTGLTDEVAPGTADASCTFN